MPRPYFLLLSSSPRPDGTLRWGIEFGTYSLADAQAERDDYRDHGFSPSCLLIMRLPSGTADTCEAAVEELNQRRTRIYRGIKNLYVNVREST